MKNPRKLSAKQAEAIRARYAAGGVTQTALAREYGVGQAQISRIIRGTSWTGAPRQKPGPKPRDVIERFWEKVDRRGDEECWPWLGVTGEHGHPQFWDGDKLVGAHVFSLELHLGRPLDPGTGPHDEECAIHSCPDGDDPRCCNPRHLRPGTRRDNVADMDARGRRRTPGRKLNREAVREMREQHRQGASIEALAKRYDLSKHAVRRALSGATWANVA